MDIKEAIKQRHSVRQYLEKPIERQLVDSLNEEIKLCNEEGGLHIQLVTDEPKAFAGFLAHYGSFRGVSNYIALVGPKSANLEEKCGYYGERIVLKAQQLGLNTCWVALTFSKVKGAYEVRKGEKLTLVIALGYGSTQGKQHKSKNYDDVAVCNGDAPQWFKDGVYAALLAPTAVNQQKFKFTLTEGKVAAKTRIGSNVKVDLGIAKYHFEVGSGKNSDIWLQ